jgi:histidinol dehydrogenase
VETRQITAATVTETVRALRPTDEDRERVKGSVADIVEMVRSGGDAAVRRLTARLDGVDVEHARVPAAAIKRSLKETSPGVLRALETLTENLRATARETMPQPSRQVLAQGQIVSTRPMPVDRAGVYAPGGRAAYPSSAVMALVPAQSHAVLAACSLAGVDEVYAIGGAQAVAAMALGTETIRPVDVLVGPGNAFVEEAKRGLFGEVGIESLAGPSELIVLADETAPPDVVAWDLRAQAEHGAGSQSVLVAVDDAVLAAVSAELPDPAGITLLQADSWDTAIDLVNAYAPEHLQLMVADPQALLERVRHAGAIFIGMMSGTAFGDYGAGSNHILPTGGRGRFSSGLATSVFLRIQEVVEIPDAAVERLAGPLADLARAEGLPAHARSAEVRAERLANASSLTEGAAT